MTKALTVFLCLCLACAAAAAEDVNVASDRHLSELNETRLNSGIPSLSAHAHAFYRLGVQARKEGDSDAALKAFAAAAQLDPNFLDPKYSIARAHLFSDAGRTIAELSAVTDVLRRDFLAQYFLLQNVFAMLFLSLAVALAVFVVMAVVRHVAELRHVVGERLSAEMPPRVAGWLGVFAALQPLLWGLGLAGTVLCCGGILWSCMSKRERFFTAVFLALVVTAPVTSLQMARRFPPLGYQSPTYVSYAALRDGWSEQHEKALLRSIQSHPEEASHHFVYGTMARRAARLGIARTELERAVELAPGEARYINNLGNVYFNLGDFDTAEKWYRKAVSADPSLPQSHYNLGQVFTKRLMFEEANAEIATAKQLDGELINDFSLNSREQLNRSVIDAGLSLSRLWSALRAEGAGFQTSEALEPALRFLGVGRQRRSVTIAFFFALSLVASGLVFRNLKTYRCTNCGKIVCRKCLSRAQKQIYCLKCAVAATSLKSPEFTRLLLANQLQLETRRLRPFSTAAAVVLPGFRLVQAGYAISGFLVVLLCTAVAVCIAVRGYWVDYLPSLPYETQGVVTYSMLLVPAVLIHALTLSWLTRKAKSRQPQLRVIRTQTPGKSVGDGATGKPTRFQSG
ncbi:MAG: tetratricopeptide repeat protein [Candidatus Eisenbacteria bacterium]|nr:tetratricopeptide repeat protein [Candidatus Eisenbacteria bacterium]